MNTNNNTFHFINHQSATILNSSLLSSSEKDDLFSQLRELVALGPQSFRDDEETAMYLCPVIITGLLGTRKIVLLPTPI